MPRADAPGVLARALAAQVVDAVLEDGRNLDTALAEHETELQAARDRALVRALAYDTVRLELRNRALLKELLQRPLRRRDRIARSVLSVGLSALQSSRRPDYAVVSASVDAVKQLGRPAFAGLVNAVLRRFLRERDALLEAIAGDDEARHLHPRWLLDALRADWPDDWEAVVEAANVQAPMWVRVNESRVAPAAWLARMPGASAPVSRLPGACLLEAPVPVDDLPGFAAGECSVQDVASQFAAGLLAPTEGDRVLDACAAPGGKAAHLLERAPGIRLLALDASAERLGRVTDTLGRLGLTADVVAGDAGEPDAWWDGEPFDRILLDAPCSATGVIRRHPDIRFLRRPSDIAELAATQQRLLAQLWPLLRPGGRLLYATCSVLRAENEAVAHEFVATHHDATLLPVDIAPPEVCLPARIGTQLRPGAFANDGFYYALMAKNTA